MASGKQWIVHLSEAERARLHRLIGSGTTAARTLIHARILLKANQGEAGAGWTDAAIAGALEIGLSTVSRVCQRYIREGLDGALEATTSTREYRRKLDGEKEAHLVALTCSEPPEGHASWSLRLLAEQLVVLEEVASISYETVRQVPPQTN